MSLLDILREIDSCPAEAAEATHAHAKWVVGYARLDPREAPGDFPDRRWRQLVDDVARFLGGPFRDTATTLGWTDLDLFGCDPDKPFARIDQAGLLLLLNGDRLIALSEDAAIIETGTGAKQTYRRRDRSVSRMLIWELPRA